MTPAEIAADLREAARIVAEGDKMGERDRWTLRFGACAAIERLRSHHMVRLPHAVLGGQDSRHAHDRYRHKSPGRRLRRVRWTAGLCVKR